MDERSAQRAFLQALLQWDYEAMFDKFEKGQGLVDELPKLGRTFASVEEYKTTFEKMMMEEALAQLMQGSEAAELILPQPAVLTTSNQVGAQVSARLVMAEEHAAKFSNTDLVVIDRTNPLDEDNAAAFVDHAIAHCEGKDGATLRLRFVLDEDAQAGDTKGRQRVERMRRLLREPMMGWWVMRLGNMATLAREWAAVQRIGVSPFRDTLLTCKARAAGRDAALEVPPMLLRHLEGVYNESQLQALTSGLGGQPFVLIQGPPGTGKTQTILGLLSILQSSVRKGSSAFTLEGSRENTPASDSMAAAGVLQRRMQQWHLSCPWLHAPPGQSSLRQTFGPLHCPAGSPQDAFGLEPQEAVIALCPTALSKRRILVCAPSNAAVDEIVLRVIKSGLLNGSAKATRPKIVRAGVSARMHASVEEVSLDFLVKKELNGVESAFQERDAAAAAILNSADVVFSTLAFSGSATFRKITAAFETIVIDEAAQALEPSCLVPLSPSVRQVYLIGDPVQLPATVISKRAVKANFEQSLFKRLQDAGYPVHILQVQYRMHPSVSSVVSNTFYAGKIRNGPNVPADTAAPYHTCTGLGPLAFYHVDGVEATPEGSASLVNTAEADMTVALVQALVTQGPEIGIISPYKSQVKLIRQSLAALLPAVAEHVDVNTIDGFQGREKQVIVFSSVRSNRRGKRSIGFVADERRINVGLSRARCSLLLVGNRHALLTNSQWEVLIRTNSDAGTLFDAKPKFNAFLKSVIQGSATPVRLAAKEVEEEVPFFAAPDDSLPDVAPKVPSKRPGRGGARGSKRQKRG